VVDADGVLQGLLHVVPWGQLGLSLDLMRRAPDAENGTVEAMVTALLAESGRLGFERLSLNFAVFRSVFARGDRLGAGPVLRLWRALLLWASRFWQIESLYRANAKYQPEWVPRFLCFDRPGNLTTVGIAALRAEAFLIAPSWIRRLRTGTPTGVSHYGAGAWLRSTQAPSPSSCTRSRRRTTGFTGSPTATTPTGRRGTPIG
jgi:lysyl-tRNA synthetase class 2